MLDVAILGAGELGGVVAYALARRDTARTILLVDPAGQVAAGKALDIMQAGPIDEFATRISGTTDVSRIAGAAIVVIADRAKGAEWCGEEGLHLMTTISRLAARSVVVCAGATQRDMVDEGVRTLGFRRHQLFGTAPEALASALRALVALEVDGSVRDIALPVLGVPPAHTVIPWEEATIGGFAATGVMDEPTRRRMSARVALLWPPGPHALAAAAIEAIDCMAGRSRRTISCFVAPEEADRHRLRTGALPVRLGPSGLARVESPALNASVQVALDNAMLL